MNPATGRQARRRGFSLIEMLIVVAVLMLVMAAILQQVNLVQKRYRTEESKLDITQEGREFLDQIVRDVHQTGYPNRRMYIPGVLMNPARQDSRVAVGLVRFSATDLQFEADVDGNGQVESIRYTLVAGGGGACPCTLQRSQVMKVNATEPMSQLTSYSTGLDGVVNSAGTLGLAGNTTLSDGTVQSNDALYGELTGAPIFTAFDASGTAVAATDLNSNPAALASVRSIGINLNVLVRPSGADFDTRLRPAVSISASARITNTN